MQPGLGDTSFSTGLLLSDKLDARPFPFTEAIARVSSSLVDDIEDVEPLLSAPRARNPGDV